MEEKTMTTKEVADILGVTTQAVRDRAKEIGKVFVERQPTRYTEEEVTAIVESMKAHPSNNLQSSTLQTTETSLTPMYKAKQFCESVDFDSDEGRKAVTATILDLCQGLLRSLSSQNDMLKHQVEYNATIGCRRWRDVKSVLGLSVNKVQMLSDTKLEEGVDYFEKCMGYDKYPTLLLTDNAVAIIKETYNIGV